jgi:hypothetical protein
VRDGRTDDGFYFAGGTLREEVVEDDDVFALVARVLAMANDRQQR